MKFVPIQIMNNVSMTTSGNSTGVDCNQIALASIQASWTGSTAAGTLQLQISNDIVPVDPSTSNPVGPDPAGLVVNWSNYTGSQTAVTGSGNFTWNLVYVGFRWIRLQYTATSGTGVINATFSGKG